MDVNPVVAHLALNTFLIYGNRKGWYKGFDQLDRTRNIASDSSTIKMNWIDKEIRPTRGKCSHSPFESTF
jgi:hypothetical protein